MKTSKNIHKKKHLRAVTALKSINYYSSQRMGNANINTGNQPPTGVIITRAGQQIPDPVVTTVQTIPPGIGTVIATRESPASIPTTLEGLVSRRSVPAGIAYIYRDGSVYVFPPILSIPNLSVSLNPNGPAVTIINELRSNNDPTIDTSPPNNIAEVVPATGVENQYYTSGGGSRAPFRINVGVTNQPANTNTNSDRSCGRFSQITPTTTIVVYNFAEPTGAMVTLTPATNMTLIGSGEIAPANSVVFSVSHDGRQLRRVSVAPLLKAVHRIHYG